LNGDGFSESGEDACCNLLVGLPGRMAVVNEESPVVPVRRKIKGHKRDALFQSDQPELAPMGLLDPGEDPVLLTGEFKKRCDTG
jgi:hypothetical protein